MITISELLVNFSDGLVFENIPEDVINKAKLHMLDSLGIALASTKTDYGNAIFNAAKRLGEGKEARVIGWGTPMPAGAAALVMGTLIHGLDFDDTHIEAIVHASAPITAAVLAVGQREHSPGKEVLEAYVLGAEIAIRLGILAKGTFHNKGFHPTGIFGTFAGSLAASKLSKLSKEQANDAMGLCVSMASGSLQFIGSWLKRMNPGWAAKAGIEAAEIGRCGFKGPRDALEGPMGLYASHLGEVPDDWSRLTGDLGTLWELKGLGFKPYPSCHFTHAFIDCVVEIRGKSQFDVDQIETIECITTDRFVPMLFEPKENKVRPQTFYDAQFSVPYLVACMLVKGKVDVSALYDEPFDDPQMTAVAEKVVWKEDPNSTFPKHFPGEVTIYLKNGTSSNVRIDINRGTTGNPMSEKEIEDKFLSNATRVIGMNQALEAMDAVKELDTCDDIGKLIDCFVI